MIIEETEIPGVLLLRPRVIRDQRGEFVEAWRESVYAEHGMKGFVQDNVSLSRGGVVRGLHFQHPQGQGKLVSVLKGKVFDVAVDVRLGSPHFGRWVAVELDDVDRCQLYIPQGFAHGFQALTDEVVFSYKCTRYYSPVDERTIRWDDPGINVAWPTREGLLAPKDASAVTLAEIPNDMLPVYKGG